MLALARLAEGFAIAHATLLIFFLIGSAAFPWCDGAWDAAESSRVMVRVAVTCGLGLAACGLLLFVLGLLGWLTVPGISVAIVALFAAACAASRTSPLRGAFWTRRLQALVKCWNWPLAMVYVALLLVGSRAIVPDATGYSDAIYYHLAYAQDWASAGRLVVDPFLFFPFYANNYVLLYAAWMVFEAGSVVQFATWASALLTGLALYASIDTFSAPVKRGWRIAIGLLAVIAAISTPIFLDYSVLGYIDVPIGCMAFLSVAAVLLSLSERRFGWLVVAAVVAGFLVGMKASYLLLVPIYLVALVWTAHALGARRSAMAAVAAIFCVVAAPWYVRNIVLAGDPIAPTINFALYGGDGLWTNTEWQGTWGDLQTSRSPRAFLTLPLRAYRSPTSPDFREYGASGLILFLYVPAAVAIVLLLMRRRIPPEYAIPIFVLAAFTLYWFVTSSLLRYALLLYPILALCMAMLLLKASSLWPRWALAALLVAVVGALPPFLDTGTIKEFTRNDFLGDMHYVLHYNGEREYLMDNDDGYPEQQLAVEWMKAHGYKGNVYVISDNAFDYYFRRDGITSIGMWIGPAGYFRLVHAIDEGRAADFLASLDTHAVLLSPQQMIDPGIGELLARQLLAAGYRDVPVPPTSRYRLLVRG